ncbi:hypothetical protein NPIL_116651 [Nephila pilipes]|uniref:Uncharacterized protein n=1 Tax=Nephila pilipes TaxID=299642 RepID=A0A8X6R0W1_NEPPI|nr:hypothetical protein NPIL_116651 [Nephila pilipes]
MGDSVIGVADLNFSNFKKILRRKEELEAIFQDTSMKNRRRKLDSSDATLVVTKNRIRDINKNVKDLE